MCDSKMRFEGAEGGDQDARGGFLTDPTPAPAPLQGPFLERALPAEDVPEARPRRRREPADRLDRAPHRRARRLDALCGAIAVGPRAALAEPQAFAADKPDAARIDFRKSPRPGFFVRPVPFRKLNG